MTANPCQSCPLFHADKNNATCRKCEKRIQYVKNLDHQLNNTPGRWQDEGPLIYNVILPQLPFPSVGG